jgi:hypothetical protein
MWSSHLTLLQPSPSWGETVSLQPGAKINLSSGCFVQVFHHNKEKCNKHLRSKSNNLGIQTMIRIWTFLLCILVTSVFEQHSSCSYSEETDWKVRGGSYCRNRARSRLAIGTWTPGPFSAHSKWLECGIAPIGLCLWMAGCTAQISDLWKDFFLYTVFQSPEDGFNMWLSSMSNFLPWTEPAYIYTKHWCFFCPFCWSYRNFPTPTHDHVYKHGVEALVKFCWVTLGSWATCLCKLLKLSLIPITISILQMASSSF